MSTDKKIDSFTGTETTGHEWDGIEELNTPLPRWWLYIFYATIVISVIYMVLFPALPALPFTNGSSTPGVLGQSDRAAVAADVADLQAFRSDQNARLLTASLDEIERDFSLQQHALAAGESAFGDNCATCHGAGGRGFPGYPRLADDVWIWGGSLETIQHTITYGIRQDHPESHFSLMPAYGRDGLLSDAEIEDVTHYVRSLSGLEVDTEKAARGSATFMNQCATCHGTDAKGDRSQGALNLTDQEWLYGSDYRTVYASIYNARNSKMPGWEDRLDEATIKALAVYVHTLSGGE